MQMHTHFHILLYFFLNRQMYQMWIIFPKKVLLQQQQIFISFFIEIIYILYTYTHISQLNSSNKRFYSLNSFYVMYFVNLITNFISLNTNITCTTYIMNIFASFKFIHAVIISNIVLWKDFFIFTTVFNYIENFDR